MPRSCATRICRACVDLTVCVAEQYPTLRICRDRGAHCAPLREKKSSAVPLFCSGHMSAICARLSPKEVGVKRVETLVSTLLPRRGARRIPALRRAQLPAEVQRKTHRPLGATRLRGSCAPDNRCRKRCCPDRAYCCATRVPSMLCAEKEAQLLLLRKKSALFLAKERQK